MVDLEHARALLEEMGLNTAAQLLDAYLEQSVHEDLTYVQFLDRLLTAEQTERRRKSQETRMKLSRLPHRKQLEDFDFDFQPSIDRKQIAELANLAFVERAENVIFLGPPGVGKTHLAVGLALKALESGKVVYYTTLSYLIEDLKKAQSQGRLDRRWRVYLRPAVLVIDEIGYSQLNRQEAELFLRLISERPVLSMVTSMLEKAFEKIPDGTGLILHSDQEWQYQQKLYQRMLKEKGIRQSMSRKGNCLDNAVIENFFGLLKTELLYLQEFESMEHSKQELIEYLDYYNNRRIKAKLKDLPPALHRQQALSVA